MAARTGRPRHDVTFNPVDTIHPITPRDDPASLPPTPQPTVIQNRLAHVPRTLPVIPPLDAEQSLGTQAPGTGSAPGHYAQAARSVYPGFHDPYLTGSATQYAAFGATQYPVGYGAPGDLVGAEDRSSAGYGYGMPPPPSTPSAPLLANASLPPTPSQGSPQSSPPGSPHVGSSSSWGTPSPEPPTRQTGSGTDLSRHLQEKFELEWDLRDQRLESLGRHEWFSKPAFLSGRKKCELTFQAAGEEWILPVRRRDGNPLTVGDVLVAIDKHVWSTADERELHKGHARYDGAVEERSYRTLGPEDSRTNTFRNVDFFPDDQSRFLGLCEVDKQHDVILVRVGSA